MWLDWSAYLKGGSTKMCKNTWHKSIMCLSPSLSLIFPSVNQSMSLPFRLFFYISCNFPLSRGCIHWTKGLCVLKRRELMFHSFSLTLSNKRWFTRTMMYDWSCRDWLNWETQRWRYVQPVRWHRTPLVRPDTFLPVELLMSKIDVLDIEVTLD